MESPAENTAKTPSPSSTLATGYGVLGFLMLCSFTVGIICSFDTKNHATLSLAGYAVGMVCVLLLITWSDFCQWFRAEVEPNKPRWTYLAAPFIQAIVAAVAAFIAFVPAYNNFQIAEKKNREDATRAAVERMDKQFTDVQTGLGNGDNIQVRAAAVLQLAELAIRPAPDAPLPEPRKTAAKPKPILTTDNYPYFTRAATQLAISLPIEEDAPVRAAMLKAVGVMTAFVKERRDDKDDNGKPVTAETETILANWVNELADANRTAKTNFIVAMAAWDVADAGGYRKLVARRRSPLGKEKMNFLVGVTRFCRKETLRSAGANTQSAIEALMRDGEKKNDNGKIVSPSFYELECLSFDPVWAKEMAVVKAKRKEADAKLFPALRVAIGQLTDSRDALAVALRTLPPVPDKFPAKEIADAQAKIDAANDTLKDITSTEQQEKKALGRIEIALKVIDERLSLDSSKRWQRSPALNLANCFLAGAILNEVIDSKAVGITLTGANLTQAMLTGANLTGADLTQATLMMTDFADALDKNDREDASATLAGAKFAGATLTRGQLYNVIVTRSDFERAKLTGADLGWVQLIGGKLFKATLTKVRLSHADLTLADLESATLTGADLDEATLIGAKVIGSKLYKAEHIPKTWNQADYGTGMVGSVDTDLIKKVETAFIKQQEKLKQK